MRRLAKTTAWGLLVIAGLLAAVLAGAWAVLQTEWGRNAVARAVVAIASEPGTAEIEVGAIGAGLPSRIALSGLKVRDAEGPWLEVDTLVIAWSPVQLLARRLSIEELRGAGVRLWRLPAAADGDEAEALAWPPTLPRLPVDVRIGELAIEDVELGPDVAGERVHLRARGRLAADAGALIRTELDIERTDAPGTRLALVGELDPQRDALVVDLELTEPEGGLVVQALDLDPYPAFFLRFQGRGPPNDWRGTLAAKAGDLVALDLDFHVAGHETPWIGIQGEAAVAPLLPAPWKPVVEGAIRLDAALAVADDDRVVIERLHLDSAAVAIAVRGSAPVADGEMDLQVTLRALAPERLSPLLAPVSVQALGIEARLTGPPTAPEIALEAAAGSLSAPGIGAARLEAKGRGVWPAFDKPGEGAWLGLELVAAGLAIDEPGLAALTGDAAEAAMEARVDREWRILDLDAFELRSGAARLTAEGSIDLADGPVDLAVSGDLASLRAAGETLGIGIDGEARITASLTGILDPPALSGSASVTIAALVLEDPLLAALAGSSLRLDGDVALAEDGSLSLRSVVLDTEAMRATAEADITDGFATLAAALRAELTSPGPLADALGVPTPRGPVVLAVDAKGPLDDPSVTAVLDLPHMRLAPVDVRSARLAASADHVATAPQGRLSLEARTSAGPVKAGTAFAVSEWTVLALTDLRAEGAGLAMTGHLSVPFGAEPMVGRASGRLVTTALAKALLDIRSRGDLQFDVSLASERNEQTATLDIRGASLAFGPDGSPGLAVGRVGVRADVTDPFGRARGRATLTMERMTAGDVAVDEARAEISGDIAKAAFEVRVRGSAASPFEARAGGTLAETRAGTEVVLGRFEGTVGGERFAVARPARLLVGADRLVVRDLLIEIGDGTLALEVSRDGAATSAALEAKALPLSLLGALAPEMAAEGTADVTSAVTTVRGELAGTLELRLANVVFAGARVSGDDGLDLSARAVWRDSRVAIDGRIGGLGASDAEFSGRFPLRIDARALALRTEASALVSGSLRWQGELRPVVEALPLTEHRLEGLGRVSADLSGTLARPQPRADIAVENGRYEHLVFGTRIEALEARASMQGTDRLVATFSGSDGGRGRLTGEGALTLATGSADVALSFENAHLVRRDDITAAATGSVRFAQQESGAKIEGRIRTERVEINLVDRLPPTVVALEVTEIRADGTRIEPRAQDSPAADAGAPALDIQVELPGRVFVRGRGLESEWGGSLGVRGTTEAPRVEGRISVVRGAVEFAGRRFDLTTGVISFDGGVDIDPRLDIAAEHRRADLTGIISIGGRASSPTVDVSSRPALPKSEVLPRILFGKSASNLGASEALQLGMAMATITGGGGIGDDPIGGARRLLGVDVLTIDPGGDAGAPGVRVGRYVGERVYVETVQGVRPGTTTYRAEIRLTPRIAFEGEVGEGTGSASGSVGLKWELEY